MKKYITNSAEETIELAEKLSHDFKNGAIISLNGPLGAGKTTFVSGFIKGFGIKSKVTSPSFVLMKEYPLPDGAGLFHIDLYRLEGSQEINNLGLTDLFLNPKNIFLIEWAEKLKDLPKTKITKIDFEYLDENSRSITLTE